MNNFAGNDIKKASKSGSGEIDEDIGESNYDDDDFDMGSGLAQSNGEDKGDGKDFFNQNKNFTGHLGGFADGKEKTSEKPSGDDSSVGFKDNYDEDFF